MNGPYAGQRDEDLYLSGTRISLDFLIYEFLRGASPDTIQANWPTLSLEPVYGAITYYLAHRESVNEYLRQQERKYANSVPSLSETAPELYAELQAGRMKQLFASNENSLLSG